MGSAATPELIARLREGIGKRVVHAGADWWLVDVLDDPPALVLERRGAARVVQSDRHGEAHRRVPERTCLPLLADDGDTLSPEVASLRWPDGLA